MTRNERELKAVEQEMVRISGEIQAIWTKADTEDRETSNEERGDVESRLKAIETLKAMKSDLEAALKVEADVRRVSGDLGKTEPVVGTGVEFSGTHWATPTRVKTPGEQFVTSPQFKALQEEYKSSGRLPQNFSTGAVSVDMLGKGTMLEGSGAPGSGTGGGLIPIPQVIPGVVQKLFQPLRIADLIMSGQTTTNSLRYIVEGTATSGAAGAGAKPEPTLALSRVAEPVKKVATSLTISDEMLEDAAQVESYINGRLSLFVEIERERQIVLGAGTDELIGITGRSINTYARGTVDNNAVALFKAMNGQRGSAFLEPDFFVINPANWQTTRLLTDTAGQFFGGGPFTSAYGGAQGPVGQSGQITGQTDMLWGKPIIVTTAIGAGTALVGTQAAAQLWYRGGLSVEASNSHSTYFLNNLVAIRAEQRIALA